MAPPTLSLTRDHLARIGGWPVLKEAEALVNGGRVEGVELDPATGFLTGKVRLPSGTAFLTPRLRPAFRLSEVEAVCSCRPSREGGIVCAHAIALGLARLKHGTAGEKASPSAAPSAPQQQPPPPSLFVPLDEAPPGAEPLFPSFLLPLQFAEAWRGNRMRIILEAAAEEGKPSQPWDAVVRGKKPPFAVPEPLCTALRILEKKNHPLPGIVVLESADFDPFFLALAQTGTGSPSASLGKKEAVRVGRSDVVPILHVTRLPDTAQKQNRLRVELLSPTAEVGEWLPSATGRWLLGNGRLTFHPGAGPALQSLSKAPTEIGIAELPHLLQLPSIAGKIEVQLDAAVAAIEWRESRPKFSVFLDGTLNALVCRLEAHYGERGFPLLGRPLPKPSDPARWIADAVTPGLFHGRQIGTETAALHDLAAAGFQAAPGNSDMAKLAGEREIIAFLADHLPEWRREWEVETSPRLASLLAQCRTIEPTIRVSSAAGGNDWLQVETSFASRDGAVTLSPGEVRQLLDTGRTHKRLASGAIALLPGKALAEWQATLADCDPESEASLGSARVESRYAPYLAETLKDRSGVTWTAPSVLNAKAAAPALPASLDAVLRPYQKEGTAWLHRLTAGGFGGILADEMGLGKTLQTLAFLLSRKESGSAKGPSLVVAPTGLLYNWQREAARFAPGLKTALLHGPDRHAMLAQAAGYDLLLTSYALLRRDGDAYAPLALDTVILDEAQHIKNRFSQNAQAVKRLRAAQRLILTGTPLENSLLDLWSMFDFLMPGYLGPAKAFRDRYETPITKTDDGPALKRLRRRIHPFLLRRTKADVAKEIPDRIESVAWCELSAEQRETYQALLEAGRREVFEHSGKQGNAAKRTMAMLSALTRLRQAACHLDLLPLPKEKKWEEPSAKLDTLFDLLEEAVDGGHRLLVFSQFTRFLDLIEARLKAEGIAFCRLDGSTSPLARQAEIDRFQGDAAVPVFLISLKAGGAGINLTAADTVVHCDPWWNPAAEDQATARAHRIGQEKVVTSYKLIARGTVEEKILQLQEKKRDLVEKTLLGEEALLSRLTQEEWEDLLAG
ncbi:SNF2 helicase associated [Verrucomicrobium sp. GAS474]|uniref:DEAD/DEAH box helicase n=1 Tax=Verrucomicrobium sp. GAS474 TaxID=1882831 RepID=UPI00087C54BD|nr:DEAD/DEAH box helicase [Verrucomicrobium sp. GAS474]SDU16840.1 SNF2 helicase associated [Verrucomicrobium sp. GAS474]